MELSKQIKKYRKKTEIITRKSSRKGTCNKTYNL